MPTVLYTDVGPDVDGQCGKLVTETVTSLPHWLSTEVHSTWDDQPFQRYGWCPPKFKWFKWPDHAPFRDGLLALATINLSTKFEVSTTTHYEDIKGDRKCRKWGRFGQLGLFKITENMHHSILSLHSNYVPILHRFWDSSILVENRRL